nr:60S ribosomal protein L22 [Candidatus Njordarchaeum guaymaensis]
MSQIIVESGELGNRGGELVGKLAEFLNGIAPLKIEAKVDGTRIVISPKTTGTKIIKKGETKKKLAKEKPEKKKSKATPVPKKVTLSKTKLKVYLKRFLNKQGLDDDLRVLSGGKEAFTFRERQVIEEQLAPLEEEK